MSAKDFADIHYIPANHVFASYAVFGAEGCKNHVKQEALRMKRDTSDPLMHRWVDWYEKTALELVDGLQQGQAVHQNYPAFEP